MNSVWLPLTMAMDSMLRSGTMPACLESASTLRLGVPRLGLRLVVEEKIAIVPNSKVSLLITLEHCRTLLLQIALKAVGLANL